MSTTQPEKGRVIFGCSDESIELLSAVVRDLERLGHTVDLVSGIDMDSGLFAQAIGRHQGRGIYVICKGIELDDYQARRLQGIAKDCGVDPGQVLALRTNQGVDDIVRRVLARLAPPKRTLVAVGPGQRLPPPGGGMAGQRLGTMKLAGKGVMRGGAATSPSQQAGAAPSLSSMGAAQAPAPTDRPTRELPKMGGETPALAAVPSPAPNPVEEDDEELPTEAFGSTPPPPPPPAAAMTELEIDPDLEVELDSDPSTDAFTPGGRIAAMFRDRTVRWVAGAAGGLLVVVTTAAMLMGGGEEAQETGTEAEVAAAMVVPTEEPTPAAVKPETQPAPAPAVEAEPEPEAEPAVEAEPEPEPEEEEVEDLALAEELPDQADQINEALRRRQIRSLDILLFQPQRSRKRLSYAKALAYCEDLEIGGVTGWRLPTVGELGTLANARMLRRDYYWSVTAADTFAERRLVIRSNNKKIMARNVKWRGARAQCVRTRDGAPAPADR